jgi:hypothetical protein
MARSTPAQNPLGLTTRSLLAGFSDISTSLVQLSGCPAGRTDNILQSGQPQNPTIFLGIQLIAIICIKQLKTCLDLEYDL